MDISYLVIGTTLSVILFIGHIIGMAYVFRKPNLELPFHKKAICIIFCTNSAFKLSYWISTLAISDIEASKNL